MKTAAAISPEKLSELNATWSDRTATLVSNYPSPANPSLHAYTEACEVITPFLSKGMTGADVVAVCDHLCLSIQDRPEVMDDHHAVALFRCFVELLELADEDDGSGLQLIRGKVLDHFECPPAGGLHQLTRAFPNVWWANRGNEFMPRPCEAADGEAGSDVKGDVNLPLDQTRLNKKPRVLSSREFIRAIEGTLTVPARKLRTPRFKMKHHGADQFKVTLHTQPQGEAN